MFLLCPSMLGSLVSNCQWVSFSACISVMCLYFFKISLSVYLFGHIARHICMKEYFNSLDKNVRLLQIKYFSLALHFSKIILFLAWKKYSYVSYIFHVQIIFEQMCPVAHLYDSLYYCIYKIFCVFIHIKFFRLRTVKCAVYWFSNFSFFKM